MGVVVEILHSTQRVRREIQKNPRTRCVLARSVGIIITTYYYYYYIIIGEEPTLLLLLSFVFTTSTYACQKCWSVVVKMKLKNEIKTQVI